MRFELIADYACRTGEGPLWHEEQGCLYWVDIPEGKIFRYWPENGQHEVVYDGEPVGGLTQQEDGRLLLFGARGSVRLWDEGRIETVIASLPGEGDSRFNDVIADPLGGVFCGTMPTGEVPGRLYRLDRSGAIVPVVEEVLCSNGMGFTPARDAMYFTDSMRKAIYLFDYEQPSGQISNRRVFVDLSSEEGIPDGMTVDAEGCIWSARWDGGCLVRYDPAGQEMMRIAFPARKVSCVTFGGPGYSDMYVTTAGGHDKAANGRAAGALFRLDVNVQGVPEFRSRVAV